MKANEMTHEQLADEMDSLDVDPARWEWKDGSHNEYYNRLNEAFEEATERLRTLTALEAKIKGMIDRPTIRVVSIDDERQLVWLTDDDKFPNTASVKVDYEGYECLVKWFGFPTIESLTKALGMEGDK